MSLPSFNKRLRFRFALLSVCAVCSDVFGSGTFTRLTTGAYVSSESFSEASDGTTANSFATVSSRVYTRIFDLTPKRLECVADLRDEHDFFDKLDAERLELTGANHLQVRQLSVRNAAPSDRFRVTVGRFPVSDAGAVNVDGASLGYRWPRSIQSTFFGGLNPRRPDQSVMRFNSDSQTAGTTLVYQPDLGSWAKSLSLGGAFVAQAVQGHVDREYLFLNHFYQWAPGSHVLAIGYLDFVPRTYIQTALLSWRQQINPKYRTTVGFTSFDSLEYSRRRGVLELLEPSSYREGSLGVDQVLGSQLSMNYAASYGRRSADHLSRIEASFGPTWNGLWGKSIALSGALGYRKNFSSRDALIRSALVYYSRAWEGSLDFEYNIKRQTDGRTEQPWIAAGSLAHYFSRAFYGIVSLEEAKSERVTIVSGFLKLGYRFGSEDVAPLRDGVPPVGGKL